MAPARWLTPLLLAALGLALLAATGQASSSTHARGTALNRAQQVLRIRANREQAVAHAMMVAERRATKVSKITNGHVILGCTTAVWEFHNFPAGTNVVVGELTIDHNKEEKLVEPFEFTGTEATFTTPLPGYPGHYQVDAWAQWKTDGVKGHFDIRGKVTCPAESSFTIYKLQRIGSTNPYTMAPVIGEEGQTVEYQIVVLDTGTTALEYSNFSDSVCDPGTISGGAEGLVARQIPVVYTCTHKLTAVDQKAGSLTNVASITATPPTGEGSPEERVSNPVVVTPIEPGPIETHEEKEEHKEEHKEETTEKHEEPKTEEKTVTTTPEGGVLGSKTSSQPTSSGETGTSSSKSTSDLHIAGLKAPQGCVRGPFKVTIASHGIASVTFYINGHKLRTLTYRNASHGLITLKVNPAQMAIGALRIRAKITMKVAAGAPASTAAHAARTVTVVHCRSAAVTPLFTG